MKWVKVRLSWWRPTLTLTIIKSVWFSYFSYFLPEMKHFIPHHHELYPIFSCYKKLGQDWTWRTLLVVLFFFRIRNFETYKMLLHQLCKRCLFIILYCHNYYVVINHFICWKGKIIYFMFSILERKQLFSRYAKSLILKLWSRLINHWKESKVLLFLFLFNSLYFFCL